MAQLTIHNLDDETASRLEARARANGRSLEEVVAILERFSTLDLNQSRELAEGIANRFEKEGRTFDDSSELIREDRDR